MEGFLEKKISFFSGWQRLFYILYDDTILEFTEDKITKIGTLHLKISKIKLVQGEPCQISINTGSCEVLLRAKNIKEMVTWYNKIMEVQ
jgi:hypothetical protein